MRNLDNYSSEYEKNYGFERVHVAYRRKVLLEQLRTLRPSVVLEVGCGTELLYEHYLKESDPVKCWLVVEPASKFAAKARAASLPNMNVIEGFLEESLGQIIDILPASPGLIVCAGVLQEVPSAQAMLSVLKSIMSKQSILLVNVPNSESFHRRLAVEMGIIPNVQTLSESNILMQQRCVYDIATLSKDLNDAGFQVVESGGFFIKPFTQLQMEAIMPVLGEQVLDGLFVMGQKYPDLASEIYVNARIANSE